MYERVHGGLEGGSTLLCIWDFGDKLVTMFGLCTHGVKFAEFGYDISCAKHCNMKWWNKEVLKLIHLSPGLCLPSRQNGAK